MTTSATSDFYAIIPAGGIGSRLWPLSRADEPKFLHDLAGTGNSLLVDTWNRLEPLAGENIVVVCGVAHKKTVRRELPSLAKANLVLEPNPKDSTAAIALAAAIIARASSNSMTTARKPSSSSAWQISRPVSP